MYTYVRIRNKETNEVRYIFLNGTGVKALNDQLDSIRAGGTWDVDESFGAYTELKDAYQDMVGKLSTQPATSTAVTKFPNVEITADPGMGLNQYANFPTYESQKQAIGHGSSVQYLFGEGVEAPELPAPTDIDDDVLTSLENMYQSGRFTREDEAAQIAKGFGQYLTSIGVGGGDILGLRPDIARTVRGGYEALAPSYGLQRNITRAPWLTRPDFPTDLPVPTDFSSWLTQQGGSDINPGATLAATLANLSAMATQAQAENWGIDNPRAIQAQAMQPYVNPTTTGQAAATGDLLSTLVGQLRMSPDIAASMAGGIRGGDLLAAYQQTPSNKAFFPWAMEQLGLTGLMPVPPSGNRWAGPGAPAFGPVG